MKICYECESIHMPLDFSMSLHSWVAPCSKVVRGHGTSCEGLLRCQDTPQECSSGDRSHCGTLEAGAGVCHRLGHGGAVRVNVAAE